MSRQVLGIVVVVLGLGGIATGCSYSRFVAQEENLSAQWGQVEHLLQRRSDLIPNLVETTKGLAQQQGDLFQSIADARTKMAGAATPSEKMAAASAESSAIGRLLVVVENDPTLKSDQTFLRTQNELVVTDNRIAAERKRYNDRARDYNTIRRTFPHNLTAALFGFKEYPYFDAPDSAKTVPSVDSKK